MKLTLSVGSLSIIKWWVDASDMNHMDCKGHSEYDISLGKGSIISFSNKQKLNTNISTETELVGADDAPPQVLWSMYFTEAQGCSIDQNITFQYNMSKMHLELNVSLSSYKITKHIKVRYFFIKDKIEYG